MRKRESTRARFGLVMLWFLVLTLVLIPAQGRAVDTDLDGFDNTIEGTTITTTDGFPIPLVSTKKDLFVILRPAVTNSLVPVTNPLEYIVHTSLAVHPLPRDRSSASKQVILASTQKAVRITEDNTSTLASGQILGMSTYGTPNVPSLTGGDANVYTKRIQEFIEQKCPSSITSVCLGTTCNPNTPAWLQQIRDVYIKHTIAHETGHMMKITKASSKTYGYHTAPGSGYLMDQFTTVVTKGTQVTFTIPTVYPPTESPQLK